MGTNFKTAFIHKSNPSASRWGVRQLKEDVLQKNGCLEKKYLKEQETQKKKSISWQNRGERRVRAHKEFKNFKNS